MECRWEGRKSEVGGRVTGGVSVPLEFYYSRNDFGDEPYKKGGREKDRLTTGNR